MYLFILKKFLNSLFFTAQTIYNAFTISAWCKMKTALKNSFLWFILFLILGGCGSDTLGNKSIQDGSISQDAGMDQNANAAGDADSDADSDIDSDIDAGRDATTDAGKDTDINGYLRLEWAKTAGGYYSMGEGESHSSDSGKAVGILSSEFSLVTGSFEVGATFGRGEPNETLLKAYGSETSDVFFAKYSPDGTLAWARNAGGEMWDTGSGIANWNNGDFILTGYSEYSAVFGEGEENETYLEGGKGIFYAKFNYNGTLEWAKKTESGMFSNGTGVKVFPDGSSLITGHFDHEAIFGEGEKNQTVLGGNSGYHLFIAKFNPDGTMAWARGSSGDGDCGSYTIDTLSDGSAYIAGFTSDGIILGEGEFGEKELVSKGDYDLLIAKYSSDGKLAWASSAGSSKYDQAYSLSAGNDGSFFLTGYFEETMVLGIDEPYETTLNNEGEEDLFIAKYDSNGSLVWAKSAGGLDEDYGRSVVSSSDGSVVMAGSFRGSITFEKGNEDEITLTAQGEAHERNIVLAKYNGDGTLLWARTAVYNAIIMNMAINDDGTAFLTGKFMGVAIFGPGDFNSVWLHTYMNDHYDMFIAKFTP